MTVPGSSRIRRLWITVGWLGVAAVIYLSLMPRPPELLSGLEQGNRVGHVLAYASLMLWFSQLTDLPVPRLGYASGLFVLAVVLELAQLATPYRTYSYMDMAAGAVGVLFGWMLAPPRLPNLLSLVERMAERDHGFPLR
jgi:hypothetical protein